MLALTHVIENFDVVKLCMTSKRTQFSLPWRVTGFCCHGRNGWIYVIVPQNRLLIPADVHSAPETQQVICIISHVITDVEVQS